MRQLTSLDAQFLALEDGRNHSQVTAVSILDPATAPGGRLELDDVRRLVAERGHLLAPFRSRLVEVPFGLDYPYWVEDGEFDLEFHVRELALPAPGDLRQLAEQAAHIHSRPLDRRKPLWELHLVHGLEHGRVALLTKMHHSAIDGVSGNDIMSVLLDPTPEGRRLDAPPPARRATEPLPGRLELLGRSVVGLARQPVRALRSIPTAGPNLDQVPAMRIIPGAASLAKLARRAAGLRGGARDGGLLERPSHHAPRTILNGRISPHRAVAFGSLSLSDAKAIKTALGVTVNDVIVALCAGAVRSWLAERDALPAEPLVAMVPMSVRTAGEHGTFGNRIAMMLVTLPSDEPDPRARVARAHEVMRSAKERHRALPATLLQDANHFVPPALFGRASRVIASLSVSDRFQPPMNLVISNVPGSPAPLYCAGARLEATYPVSAIADGVGLNITAFSYRESVDFGVVADRELVREPAAIVAALHAELDALRTLARAGVR